MLICPVDVDPLIAWIDRIDFAEWPQQHRLADGKIRPAMVTDLEWHGFARATDAIVRIMLEHFPGCVDYQRMLSVVMPGHSIAPHVDGQSPGWMCRVHLPLTSNDQSCFIVAGKPMHMAPGFAYRVDTTVEHAVVNDGDTPRIHFMFDIGKPC